MIASPRAAGMTVSKSGLPRLMPRPLVPRCFDHEHPVAMRLFPGPQSGWESRAADLATNRRIGSICYRKLIQHFAVAERRMLDDAFACP